MTQQISVTVKTTGALTIAAGIVADQNGNLWNLPGTVNVASVGVATVTATADAANPNAPFPGTGEALTIENPQTGWISAATSAQLTNIEFVTMFPEFSAQPAALINFWLNLAYKRLPACVWNDLLDDGAALYSAHNIALQIQNQKQATAGIQPGQNVGPLNNKSVDKASAGYDTTAGSVEDGGNYNLTNYGTRFLELVDIVGAANMAQIGTGGWFLPGTVVGPGYVP